MDLNEAPTNNLVAIVKHCRLTRRDGALRLVELHRNPISPHG